MTTRQPRVLKAPSQTGPQLSGSQPHAQGSRISPQVSSRARPSNDIASTPIAKNASPSQSIQNQASVPRPLPPRMAQLKHQPVHPLPERPVSAGITAPRPRRPPPSKSRPVEGWTAIDALPNSQQTPLFGSFVDPLSINTTPKLGSARMNPIGSPPSPSLFGPAGPYERVTKQRGKVAIGLDGGSSPHGAISQATESSQGATLLASGNDAERWFVVADSTTTTERLNSLQLESHPQQPLEFGRFSSAATSSATPSTPASLSQSLAESRNSTGQDQSSSGKWSTQPSNADPRNFRGKPLGLQSYRSNQPGYVGVNDQQSGGRRNMSHRTNGRNGPNYRLNGGGSNGGSGGGRTMSNPSGFRQNQHQPSNAYISNSVHSGPYANPRSASYPYDGYNPQQPVGYGTPPLVPTAPNQFHQTNSMYHNPQMAPNPYMTPYGTYPYSPYTPPLTKDASPQTPATLPIPMPASPTPFGLDPLKYWLLGQVSGFH